MGVVLDFGRIGGVGRIRCVSFPTLYAVVASEGTIVEEVWETMGGRRRMEPEIYQTFQ